jgi:hypothetical protein
MLIAAVGKLFIKLFKPEILSTKLIKTGNEPVAGTIVRSYLS